MRYLIWQSDEFSVYSDGRQFVAQIQAFASVLSVGYSSVNGAYRPPDRRTGISNWEHVVNQTMSVGPIQVAIRSAYEQLEMRPLIEMMPGLLMLAQAADRAWNDQLFAQNHQNDVDEHEVIL